MSRESVKTADLILYKTAPIFNKQGYIGTSLSDLTKATGLTKGAIYCNFENKEDLAVQAFKLNINKVIQPLFKSIGQQNNSMDKLFAITDYYKTYYDLVKKIGGCPLLRVGTDSKFNNAKLYSTAKKYSQNFVLGLSNIIKEGIKNKEINKNTSALENAKVILSIIEGSILMAFTHDEPSYIIGAMEFIETSILEKISI